MWHEFLTDSTTHGRETVDLNLFPLDVRQSPSPSHPSDVMGRANALFRPNSESGSQGGYWKRYGGLLVRLR